jgi:hypothetical protein
MTTNPHPSNSCAGAYPDWLEINLLPECNGRCPWCVEKDGWQPKDKVSWDELVRAAIATGRKNFSLLGGEPTMHPDLRYIVALLRLSGGNPWVTTNGSLLSSAWVQKNLNGVWGVNISVHHYDLDENRMMTGISLSESVLREAVEALHEIEASVRFNCNCVKGYIDTRRKAGKYIRWAKGMGADEVRFAELMDADDLFVDLNKVFGEQEGRTTDDPFCGGCSHHVVIDNMPVNIRQVCGFHTKHRPAPVNPGSRSNPILYPDGVLYHGWQKKENNAMCSPSRASVHAEIDDAAQRAIKQEQDRVRQSLQDLGLDEGTIAKVLGGEVRNPAAEPRHRRVS